MHTHTHTHSSTKSRSIEHRENGKWGYGKQKKNCTTLIHFTAKEISFPSYQLFRQSPIYHSANSNKSKTLKWNHILANSSFLYFFLLVNFFYSCCCCFFIFFVLVMFFLLLFFSFVSVFSGFQSNGVLI